MFYVVTDSQFNLFCGITNYILSLVNYIYKIPPENKR